MDKRELKIYKFKEARKNLNKKINEMELFSKCLLYICIVNIFFIRFKYEDRNKSLVD